MGNDLYEIKSLGKNGWINIVYTDSPENNTKNLNIIKEIAYSIKHKEKYNADYKEAMNKSGDSSKLFIISLFFLLLVTGIRKLINTKST